MARPKIGLVLGGGGSRGLAHLGVLSVLEREKFPIDLIVGTSMGGIIGTLYALGYKSERIAERMIKNMQGSTLLNMNLFSARARQRAVRDQLRDTVGDKTFHDLKIPVVLMAVDMRNGAEVQLSEGALMPAILATSAVPGVFPPVEIDGRQLADGGVIDSLATHVAYERGVDKIIAVDVYPRLETDNPWVEPLSAIVGIELPFGAFSISPEWQRIPSIPASIWRAVRVMTWHLHQLRLESSPPDVLLRPAVDGYGSLDFKDVRGPLAAGAAEAEKHLPALLTLIGEQSAPV